jgi:heme-degrading monooxygenase HmoA
VTEHAGVVQIATFTTDADQWGQLIQALHRLSEEARGAEGCFGAQVCSVEDHPDAVAVVSRWRSQGSLDAWLLDGGESTRIRAEELAGAPAALQTLTSLSPS